MLPLSTQPLIPMTPTENHLLLTLSHSNHAIEAFERRQLVQQIRFQNFLDSLTKCQQAMQTCLAGIKDISIRLHRADAFERHIQTCFYQSKIIKKETALHQRLLEHQTLETHTMTQLFTDLRFRFALLHADTNIEYLLASNRQLLARQEIEQEIVASFCSREDFETRQMRRCMEDAKSQSSPFPNTMKQYAQSLMQYQSDLKFPALSENNIRRLTKEVATFLIDRKEFAVSKKVFQDLFLLYRRIIPLSPADIQDKIISTQSISPLERATQIEKASDTLAKFFPLNWYSFTKKQFTGMKPKILKLHALWKK